VDLSKICWIVFGVLLALVLGLAIGGSVANTNAIRDSVKLRATIIELQDTNSKLEATNNELRANNKQLADLVGKAGYLVGQIASGIDNLETTIDRAIELVGLLREADKIAGN
jgi:methyl-accepting chemotaxis protein